MIRCPWAQGDELMTAYHDAEWGVPVRDSRALWEMLMLEGFQAGLSWSTILKRRDGFRYAFDGFDPAKVAQYGDTDIERLMADPSIIRARAKILATISGARIYQSMESSGESFSDYVWRYVDGQPIVGDGVALPAKTELSETISTDLKKRGFKFCGPVIVYAWMQAVGLVNDHAVDCFRRGVSS